MKKFNAVFATMVPWMLIAFVFVWDKKLIGDMGFIFLVVSPIYIAGVMLVSYREGQWSVKK